MTLTPSTSEITYRQLDPQNEEDFERAVQVMVSSFSIMPTWTKFYRGKDTSRARAKAIYYLRAVGHLGEIWATEGTNEAAESVIAFIPPGTVYSEAPSIHEDNKAFLATLGEDHIPVPPDSSKITFIHPTYDSTKVIKDSWSIILIGTTPNSAGKGLGRKLVQLVLDRAGTEGRGVWVPTTLKARMSFYEKMGFVHIKTIETVSELGDPASEYHLYRPVEI